MTAALIWFTFRDDAACLEQSVRAARHHAPEARRIIAQQASAPLPMDVQARLREAGCQIETDFVDRQGNLRGLEHFAHQLDWFAAAGEGADWLIKIDSDTVVNAPLESWLGQAGPEHTAVCGWQPTWWFQGPCYAIRPARLPALRDHLAAHQQCLRECAPHWPEDPCLAHLVVNCDGPAAILALPGGDPSTLFTGWQIAHFDFRHWPAFDFYRDFRTVHFGNRTQLPKDMPDPVRRLTAARTMSAFLDATGVPA